MKRKIFSVIGMAVMLLALTLFGCGGGSSSSTTSSGGGGGTASGNLSQGNVSGSAE